MAIYLILFGLNLVTIPFFYYSKKIYLAINITLLWLLMAFRSFSVGSDTISYVQIYKQTPITYIPNNFINWFFPANGARFENGYLLLNKILYSINEDPRFLIIVTSTIYISCLIFMLSRLHLNYVTGIVSFETLGFMAFLMSGIRQGLACSLCMVAFVYAVEKKPIKFLLFNYLALSMHVSATIFLIVYLFNFLKNNKRNNVLIVMSSLILIFFFDDLYSGLSSNSNELSNFSLSNSQNAGGFLNVIISTFIILFILILGKYYLKKDITKSYLFSNYMLIYGIVFLIISIRSTQISRVALYFEIGYFAIISDIFKHMEKRKQILGCILVLIAMTCYFVVIQLFRPEWSGIIPYSLTI